MSFITVVKISTCLLKESFICIGKFFAHVTRKFWSFIIACVCRPARSTIGKQRSCSPNTKDFKLPGRTSSDLCARSSANRSRILSVT